jgi:outer membrane autotransporter protein
MRGDLGGRPLKSARARCLALLSTSSLVAYALHTDAAFAGCGATSAGNDIVVCDAGTAPDPTAAPVDLQAGNDTLTVTSGTYSGGFTGGAGTKTVTFGGGTIANYTNTVGTSLITLPGGSTVTVTGGVTTGAGADRFEINAGTVNGAVSQGGGIDIFVMTGGTIGSLAQGDGLDNFQMSGGTIVGAFEDGDVATMTGGTIGRVDMKLDNNIFDMSGGRIIGNLVTGFGNDTIIVSGGSIGGNISVSGGTDSVTVTGGAIGGEIRMSTGTDTFLWQGGGTIGGLIDMGDGDDTATLRNLGDAQVSATQTITGGNGTDLLVLAGAGPTAMNASLVTGFERLNKIEAGTWTLSGSLADFQTVNVQQGTLRLTGDNSAFAGQTIVDPAGILEGPALGITPAVTNNGLVRFTQPDVGTYAGTISGVGAVEKTGAGTTILTGANTYSGGTTITQGTLQLGAGGTSGSIVGNVANNGTLAFNRSDLITFAGIISGTGAVTQDGSGTTVLTSVNTYTGATSVTAGTLAVGNAANPGAALAGGGPITVAAGATLGGYGRVAGSVTNAGTIAVADAVAAFAGAGKGNFTIAGTLTNAGQAQVGGAGIGNTLTVSNYVGQGGTVGLNTYLGSDGSPSDLLVINGGTASGTSRLAITNVGGPGGATTGDGILVINAINGATTSASAFSLAGPVAAGAYEYILFHGSATGGSSQSWYLRNTVVAETGGSDTEAAPGSPILPEVPAGSAPVPLYRPEVAAYAAVPAMARRLGVATLGTFHQRRGEQSLLDGQGNFAAGWGRVFGERTEQRWSGAVDPEFDGRIWGLQTGLDLYGIDRPSGHRDRFGLFFGYGRAEGDIRGFAVGQQRSPTGKLTLDSKSLGAYWTHLGPTGWYVDAVLMHSWLDGDARSNRGVRGDIEGSSVSASLEGGYPISLGAGFVLEPQAQFIWQHLSLDQTRDRFSVVSFDNGDSLTGRIGARLQTSFLLGSAELQPYLTANLWHNFSRTDKVLFDATDVIPTRFKGTSLEVGGGVVAKITTNVCLYATGGYVTALGDDKGHSLRGNLGLRVIW